MRQWGMEDGPAFREDVEARGMEMVSREKAGG